MRKNIPGVPGKSHKSFDIIDDALYYCMRRHINMMGLSMV